MSAKSIAVGAPFERAGVWYYVVTVDGERVERGPYDTRATAARSCTRQTRRAARAERARALSDLAEIPEWDGTLRWWQTLIAKLARDVASSGEAESRNNLRAVADAGRTAKALWDQSDLESQVAQLQRDLAVMRRAERHGIGTEGPSTGPSEPA